MVQIKTFKFIMSNIARVKNIKIKNGRDTIELDNWDTLEDTYCKVANENEIDNTINKFIKDKNVINVLVNDYTINHHNNGRNDTVERTYTIIYNKE